MLQTGIEEKLAMKWNECGLNEGDLVLVHSSLKNILEKLAVESHTNVSPINIYNSLLKAVGKNGTLILPLFNFNFPDTGFFDIRSTPSQMGALTEVGRLDKNSVRTGHPIYSFAIVGSHVEFFRNINNYSGYGENSPFGKIHELDGKIAAIGLPDEKCMTSYHYVEEQNAVDYRYHKEFTGTYIDQNGRQEERAYSLYVRDIERGVQTDVQRMGNFLWDNGYYKGEKFNEGYGLRTIDFRDLYDQTEKIIKEGRAKDFLYSIKSEKEPK